MNPADQDPALAEHISTVVERARREGNSLFGRKQYDEAAARYSQALSLRPTDHVLLANRCAALLALLRLDDALADAERCTKLAPTYAKGWFRLGSVLRARGQLEEAQRTYERAGALSGPKEVATALSAVADALDASRGSRAARERIDRAHAAHVTRRARERHAESAMEAQWRQAGHAPEWVAEDYTWRYAFSIVRHNSAPLSASDFDNAALPTLRAYVNGIAELEAPRLALERAGDACRAFAWRVAARSALAEQPGAFVVVDALPDAGSLACAFAAAGAASVALAAPGLAAGVAEDALSHSDLPIDVFNHSLFDFSIETEDAPPASGAWTQTLRWVHARQGAAPSAARARVPSAAFPRRADVVVVDRLDHTVLGCGLLDHVDFAARHLLAPGGRLLPRRVHVYGQLASVTTTAAASTVDVQSVDRFWWYPGIEKVDLAKHRFVTVSDPFVLSDIDLQGRADSITLTQLNSDAVAEPEGAAHDPPPLPWEQSGDLVVTATRDVSSCNAVLVWSEAEVADDVWLASRSRPCAGANVLVDADATPVGVHFLTARGEPAGGVALRTDDTLRLRVRRSAAHVAIEAVRICRTTPSTEDETAVAPGMRFAWAPRWHFEMLSDGARNRAYVDAIRRAVASLKLSGAAPVHVLDMGTGTGLLAIEAARAGADGVVAAEMTSGMCEVAQETVLRSGVADKVTVLQADVRRLQREAVPGQQAPDIPPGGVNLVVFELFDSGLLGEGCLHCAAHAARTLLAPGGRMLPAGARIWCQLIQAPLSACHSKHDAPVLQRLEKYRWRPDYEPVDLAAQLQRRGGWRALSEPVPALSFDFYDAAPSPTSVPFDAVATGRGRVHAVAFWFDLHLDDETTLSTAPGAHTPTHDAGDPPGGTTWSQCVQWVTPVDVDAGDVVTVTASHDTYGASFAVGEAPAEPCEHSAVAAVRDAVERTAAALARQATQDPVARRAATEAAAALAAHAGEFGVPQAHAARLLSRMML